MQGDDKSGVRGGMRGQARRGARRLVAAALAMVAGALMVGVGSASAAYIHPFIKSFGGTETPARSIVPFGVAVDNSKSASAGDVYVSDYFHRVVDKFSAAGVYLSQLTGTPSGAFESFSTLAQNAVNASGDVYVGDLKAHVVDEFGPEGKYLAQIAIPGEGRPYAVAVNGAGEVLIANAGSAKDVLKYDPTTEALSTFATGTPAGGFSDPIGVAVDDDAASPAFGDVYVVDGGVVDVFSAAGTYLRQITGTPSGAFSLVLRDFVDPATGDLYVGAKEAVYEFGPEGNYITTISVPGKGTAYSVAVDAATEEVYVANAFNGAVDIFGPLVVVPNVSTTAPTGVQPTEATLHGQVEPAGGGEVTGCEVEYGTSSAYGSKAACEPATPYNANQAVAAKLSGLSNDTVYHYRLAATNANGTNYSEDATFETTGPPTITGEKASGIEQASATVEAKIDPHGFATTYQVEYGETQSYGHTVPVPAASVGSGTTPEAVSQKLTGLKVSTGYHYRFVATSSEGTIDGSDQTFTSAPPASIENLSWIGSIKDATIKARIDVYGASSTCQFQYVDEAQFKSSGFSGASALPCTPEALSAEEPAPVIVKPAGLALDTVYHFRFIVENAFGREIGAEQSFVTFGVESMSAELTNAEGKTYTQAGGHPYALTTKIVLNTNAYTEGEVAPAGKLKDVRVQLPPGLIGNPTATAKCSRIDSEQKECSGAAQVGTIVIKSAFEKGTETHEAPLFNIVPPKGVAAEFGGRFNGFANGFITARVRTGEGYGISADSLNISTLDPLTSVTVKMWGVPGDPSHDAERSCPTGEHSYRPPCSEHGAANPFLTDPTSCTGPITTTALVDTYQAPSEVVQAHEEMSGMTGCEKLRFSPTIAVTPESSVADSPTGLTVDLHVPQEESATGLAEADLKDATVTLPAGVTVNPASAAGLVGCSEAQIELKGPRPGSCPDASKIGSVELITPLIDHPLPGAIYLAQQGNAGAAQGSNPFGSLLALYIAIDDPETGVVVKLAGQVHLDPETGQLTTSFDENPQLPFEDLKLDFFGGERAALATPRTCGTYTTTSLLEPWSHQGAPGETGTPDASPTSVFEVTSGPGGSGCAASPFAPSFEAGTANNQAGGFGSFIMNLTRQDGEQRFGQVSMTMPPGMEGMISHVTPCPEVQANEGDCPASSQIGNVVVQAGVGSEPVTLPEVGRPEDPVFLTERYEGAPFGISIVVHAEAGPFNLGTVVVRGKIDVNPATAQVSIVTDASGPHAMPTILQGIPVDVKAIHIDIDKPDFMFNGTSCEPMSVTGTIGSAEGASAAVSSRYQAAGCAALPFHPTFEAIIHAQHSRRDGEYLHVIVTSGAGQANIAKVEVKLPKDLPSRLETLKQACSEEQFAKDPAGCDPGSIVGSAIAHTPVLTVPLSGPVYFVSHGGKAYPELVAVLQGDGVTVELRGETFINKENITESKFNTVPDVPITRFDMILPAGPHSALAGIANMCRRAVVSRRRVRVYVKAHSVHGRLVKGHYVYEVRKVRRFVKARLQMPTHITGQNGALVHQDTVVKVTGCGRLAKPAGRHGKGSRS